MHYFSETTTVVFVASLASYRERSEDNSQSGLGEALDVFRDVLKSEDLEEAMVVVERAFDAGEPLHLVLADVHMPPPQQPNDLGLEPGDGGLALFSLLQGQRPELPCILWSGAASEGVASWALDKGARAFLRKPVQPLELRQEVQRVLDEVWGRAS